MHRAETNFFCVADKSCPLDTFYCLFSSTPAATACARSAATSCVSWIAEAGRTMDQDVPGFLPSDDIDLVFAALLKGLPGIDAEELEVLFKDLPMPEPGA